MDEVVAKMVTFMEEHASFERNEVLSLAPAGWHPAERGLAFTKAEGALATRRVFLAKDGRKEEAESAKQCLAKAGRQRRAAKRKVERAVATTVGALNYAKPHEVERIHRSINRTAGLTFTREETPVEEVARQARAK